MSNNALAVAEYPADELNTFPPASGSAPFLEPIADIDAIMYRHGQLLQYRDRVLKQNVDYGAIPGAGDKMVLFKPGAEKIDFLFGLRPTYEVIERVEDWDGRDHGGEPFFHYLVLCRLLRRDTVVAEHMGSCNSWESKYRYRKSDRVCPHCSQEAIRKSRQNGEGWYCWRKVGGCGATFAENDAAIVNQEVGRRSNPDVADVVNTVLKMALKRAHVGATLAATMAGEFFAVEADDYEEGAVYDAPAAANGSTPAPRPGMQNARAQNAPSPQRAQKSASAGPPATRTPRFKELVNEAANKKWAYEDGQVNQFRLLNAIRAGGFEHDAITNENLHEARAAMHAHYAPNNSAPVAPGEVEAHEAEIVDDGASTPVTTQWPCEEVGQSDAFQYFLNLCDDKRLPFSSSPAGRKAFEIAFSELLGVPVAVAEMTALDFENAYKSVQDGSLRW
jgi:hypothetical protein